MKPVLILLLFIALSACQDEKSVNSNAKSNENQKASKLVGAWEMTGYYNFVDNKIADSFQTNHGFRQVKMFTDHKVMWSKTVAADSTEWFGYGTYSVNNDELTETLEYGSVMMRKIVEEKKEFKYELILENDKFCQIEIDDKGNRLYSENYRRIE